MHFIVYIFIIAATSIGPLNGEKWPLFVIGHMANSDGDVLSYLKLGANAVETDVTFTKDGHPEYNYHGFPCDCFRYCFWSESFKNYLLALRKTISDSKWIGQLSMVYFDLKVHSLTGENLANAGKHLALDIVNHLLLGVDENHLPLIIIGVPDVIHLVLLEKFEKTLVTSGFNDAIRRIAYDVYQSRKKSDEVLQLMTSSNITKHVWYGQGYSNCFLPSYSNIKMLIEMRDGCEEPCDNSPDAIYHWTIDGPENQRNSLRLGIDGIVTNDPKSVINILKEEEFANVYRLAKSTDVPWTN